MRFVTHAHIFPSKSAYKASSAIGEFYNMGMKYPGESSLLLRVVRKINVSKYLVCSTATVPEQTEKINDFYGNVSYILNLLVWNITP